MDGLLTVSYCVCLFRTFLNELSVEVVPSYLIASKEAVKERAPANYVRKKVPEVTNSFHQYMVKVSQQTVARHCLLKS